MSKFTYESHEAALAATKAAAAHDYADMQRVEPGQTARHVPAQLPPPEATPVFPLMCCATQCRPGREL